LGALVALELRWAPQYLVVTAVRAVVVHLLLRGVAAVQAATLATAVTAGMPYLRTGYLEVAAVVAAVVEGV
jgi:hypothetical protein